jgi:6-phosphogluconate dehydrogenase
MQSVFLGDITSAYEKNPNLESLLFDGFFNKGGRLWPPTLVICALNWVLSYPQSTAGLAAD